MHSRMTRGGRVYEKKQALLHFIIEDMYNCVVASVQVVHPASICFWISCYVHYYYYYFYCLLLSPVLILGCHLHIICLPRQGLSFPTTGGGDLWVSGPRLSVAGWDQLQESPSCSLTDRCGMHFEKACFEMCLPTCYRHHPTVVGSPSVGLWNRGGCWAAAHASQVYLNHLPSDRAMVKVDFQNAFNFIPRDIMFSNVEDYNQVYYLLFTQRTVLIPSSFGMRLKYCQQRAFNRGTTWAPCCFAWVLTT